MSDTPAAGWYPDPSDASKQRYWDGTQWTEHTAEGAAAAPAAAASTGGFAAGAATGGFSSAASGGTAPDPWLWQSIVATLFCCLPFGIAGIVNAAKSNSLAGAGDIAGATVAAAAAKKWTMVSIGVGVAFVVVYLIFMAVVLVGAGSSGF